MKKVLLFIFSLLIPLGAGFVGSLFTTPAITGWYTQLNRPMIAPPNWLFAPVWTTLFLLMGIALFVVWQKKSAATRKATLIFILQLLLNVFWSIIFFYLKNPFYALVEIVVLWLIILINIVVFWRVNKIAGALLIPYILWVSFAAFLNFSFWQLNK